MGVGLTLVPPYFMFCRANIKMAVILGWFVVGFVFIYGHSISTISPMKQLAMPSVGNTVLLPVSTVGSRESYTSMSKTADSEMLATLPVPVVADQSTGKFFKNGLGFEDKNVTEKTTKRALPFPRTTRVQKNVERSTEKRNIPRKKGVTIPFTRMSLPSVVPIADLPIFEKTASSYPSPVVRNYFTTLPANETAGAPLFSGSRLHQYSEVIQTVATALTAAGAFLFDPIMWFCLTSWLHRLCG